MNGFESMNNLRGVLIIEECDRTSKVYLQGHYLGVFTRGSVTVRMLFADGRAKLYSSYEDFEKFLLLAVQKHSRASLN